MTKRYKLFLESLTEATPLKSATPQYSEKGKESKDTKRSRDSMLKDLNPKVDGSIASIISDIVNKLPSSYDSLKTDQAIKDLSQMASKAVNAVERDKELKPINIRSKDGLGTLSSNFEDLSPLYKALYLTVASKLSPNAKVLADYDEKLPFAMIRHIMNGTDSDVSDVLNMSNDEIRSALDDLKGSSSTERRTQIMSKLFNNLAHFTRSSGSDDAVTLTGRPASSETIATKGHGRLNKLVQTLVDIDREYFEKNANTSGQNYGGVKDTNDAIDKFVKSMVTQKTKSGAIKNAVDLAKSDYESNKDSKLKDITSSLSDMDKNRLTNAINKLDTKISRLSDPNKIYNLITDYIHNGDDTQKVRKLAQRYYSDFRKAVKKGNVDIENLETPVEPNLMKQILKKIYEVDAEAVHAPQLNAFIEKNYSKYPDVVRTYRNLLKKSGLSDSEPIELDRDQAVGVGNDIGVPVSSNIGTDDGISKKSLGKRVPGEGAIDIDQLDAKVAPTLTRAQKKQKEEFINNAKKRRLMQGKPIDDAFLQRAEDAFMKRLEASQQESFLDVMIGLNKLLDESI